MDTAHPGMSPTYADNDNSGEEDRHEPQVGNTSMAIVPDHAPSQAEILPPGTSDARSSIVCGIGMWKSWERNFTSGLLALLDLIDNAMDATMSTHSFKGKIHIYGDVDMQRDQITGICIKNNCRNRPQDIQKVLEAYSSSKINDVEAIGENGIGVKQACAAISDLSWVCIKNRKKIGLGVLAKGLQTQTSLFLPSYRLNEDTLAEELSALVNSDKELRYCMTEYGNGNATDGEQRVLKHLQDLSKWGGEQYVFLVVAHNCRGKDGPYKLVEILQSELPQHYLHVPADFDVRVNEHSITFQYWERRLAELHRFTLHVDPINPWTTADDWYNPKKYNEYNLYLGFDPNRHKDNMKASLLIHSRKSGRLIKKHADARGLLYLDSGGTMYAQGLTIILDDFQGRLPLTPTKQDLAFSTEGACHQENLYHWIGAFTQVYYTYFLERYTEHSKTELSTLVGSVKRRVDALIMNPSIKKPLMLGEFSILASCLPDGVLCCVPFKRIKSDKIRCSNKKEVNLVPGPDTLVKFVPPVRAIKKAPVRKKPASKKRRIEEEKDEGGPPPGQWISRHNTIVTTSEIPTQAHESVATGILAARVKANDALIREKSNLVSQLTLELQEIKFQRRKVEEGEGDQIDDAVVNDRCSPMQNEINRLNLIIQELKKRELRDTDAVDNLKASLVKQTALVLSHETIIKSLRLELEDTKKGSNEIVSRLQKSLASKDSEIRALSRQLESLQMDESACQDSRITDASSRESHQRLHNEVAVLRAQNNRYRQELKTAWEQCNDAKIGVAAANTRLALIGQSDHCPHETHQERLMTDPDKTEISLLFQEDNVKSELDVVRAEYEKAIKTMDEMKEALSMSLTKSSKLEMELEGTKKQLISSESHAMGLIETLKAVEVAGNSARGQVVLSQMGSRANGEDYDKHRVAAREDNSEAAESTVALKKQIVILTAQVKYFRTKYETEQALKTQLEDMVNMR